MQITGNEEDPFVRLRLHHWSPYMTAIPPSHRCLHRRLCSCAENLSRAARAELLRHSPGRHPLSSPPSASLPLSPRPTFLLNRRPAPQGTASRWRRLGAKTSVCGGGGAALPRRRFANRYLSPSLAAIGDREARGVVVLHSQLYRGVHRFGVPVCLGAHCEPSGGQLQRLRRSQDG